MKSLTNADQYPDTLNIAGLNVQGSISAGNIVSNTVVADTTTSTTVDSDLISTNSLILPANGSINFGLNPFTYTQGTWTPLQSTLKIIGLGPASENVDWDSPRNVTSYGYYIKLGGLVTVYFETSVTFDGLNNDNLSFRTPVIQGLPFRSKTPTANDLAMGGVVEAVFPNGYVLGLAAPLAVTMDGGFQSQVLEQGATFTSREPPAYNNPITWVNDGYTIFLSCAQSQFTLLGGIGWTGLEGNVYNANIIFTGTNYVSSFKGSLTYFTDE